MSKILFRRPPAQWPHATSAAALIVAALLGACSSGPMACERTDRAPCSSFDDVSVIDRTTGSTLPVYWFKGQRWVAGEPGHRYAIRVTNSAPGRRLAVISVDGINALSGTPAGWNQGGYVLQSGESYDILGWRKSQERVADFVFTDPGSSYASQSGRPANIGVIGLALFREKVAVPQVSEAWRAEPSNRAAAAPEASGQQQDMAGATAQRRMAPAAPSLGTGHGEQESSTVSLTEFERARQSPDVVVTIRYERPERLVAMGIMPGRTEPNAFPQSAGLGFVPDPPQTR